MTRVGLHVLVRFGVAALVIAALAAFGSMQASAQEPVIVAINELNGSGVSGDAELTDNGDGTTTIDVLVDGGTAGGVHPIHLHSGTCAELGDVVVGLTDVEVGDDGTGSSVTDVPVPLASIQDPEIGPHAINIHLSADEIQTYIACGDVATLSAAAGGETTTATAEPAAVPATGIGSAAESSSTMAIMGMIAAAVVFVAGLRLRRSAVRA